MTNAYLRMETAHEPGKPSIVRVEVGCEEFGKYIEFRTKSPQVMDVDVMRMALKLLADSLRPQ